MESCWPGQVNALDFRVKVTMMNSSEMQETGSLYVYLGVSSLYFVSVQAPKPWWNVKLKSSYRYRVEAQTQTIEENKSKACWPLAGFSFCVRQLAIRKLGRPSILKRHSVLGTACFYVSGTLKYAVYNSPDHVLAWALFYSVAITGTVPCHGRAGALEKETPSLRRKDIELVKGHFTSDSGPPSYWTWTKSFRFWKWMPSLQDKVCRVSVHNALKNQVPSLTCVKTWNASGTGRKRREVFAWMFPVHWGCAKVLHAQYSCTKSIPMSRDTYVTGQSPSRSCRSLNFRIEAVQRALFSHRAKDPVWHCQLLYAIFLSFRGSPLYCVCNGHSWSIDRKRMCSDHSWSIECESVCSHHAWCEPAGQEALACMRSGRAQRTLDPDCDGRTRMKKMSAEEQSLYTVKSNVWQSNDTCKL